MECVRNALQTVKHVKVKLINVFLAIVTSTFTITYALEAVLTDISLMKTENASLMDFNVHSAMK